MASTIHPTAIISPGAELGVDVQVEPYAVIGPHVKLGDRTIVGAHAIVGGHTTVGEECRFSPHSSVGGIPQDLKYKGEPTELVLGKRNMVREFVTIHIGTVTGKGITRIGDANLFMANSHVAHDCTIGNNCVLANCVSLAGHVQLGNNVILGGLVGVHQFVRIGSYAILSAGSMLGTDLTPFCIGQGDRSFLRGINLIGLKRAGMTLDDVKAIKHAYRHFFSTHGHFEDKIQSLPVEFSSNPRVQVMVEFIANAGKRGLCQPPRGAADEDEEFLG